MRCSKCGTSPAPYVQEGIRVCFSCHPNARANQARVVIIPNVLIPTSDFAVGQTVAAGR